MAKLDAKAQFLKIAPLKEAACPGLVCIFRGCGPAKRNKITPKFCEMAVKCGL